ncbi:uncharacterized protein [Leptinotarsa decemlineata]|uniref:uncharacterized protein n=1 Tax=Leptinotarsa decemlineata TaxID=7539 RepID=UPI003D307BB5
MQNINNYTIEEEQQIVRSATRRKELKRHDQIIKEKHFRIRNNSIQNYFIRMSCENKEWFVLRLMGNISLAGVLQILHVMSWSHTKMAVYNVADPETNFIYDKLILDHNRMLDEKVLAETMDNDIAWFATLEEYFQVSLVTDLIRMSSGIVKRKLCLPIFRLYHRKLAQHRRSQWKTGTDEKWDTQSSATQGIMISEDEDEYDPKHPASVEVEKQRKKWAEMIAKYRAEVEVSNKTDLDNAKKEENPKKKATKAKKKETETSKTKTENSKKRKDGKGDKMEGIDVIQLVPIWIVKKIFGYLDQKTLLTIKHVNSYWSYVVQEILKERKTREKINKYLETLEAKIDPKKLESSLKSSEKPSYKTPKRLHNIYYELGAIPKKIVPTQKKNLVDTCLISEATKELEDEFALHTGELVSFPRLIKQDIQLYRHLPCFLQDVNVRYDDGSDIQRQRSILTYSLTSIMSTLKICVNEQDLSDW